VNISYSVDDPKPNAGVADISAYAVAY